MVKKIIGVLVLVFLLLQVVPTKRNNKGSNEGDILSVEKASPEVASLLKASCYDCHSNKTDYPWYTNLQPAKYFIQHHVVEGKSYVNFGDWKSLTSDDKEYVVEESINQIDTKHMPIKGYKLLHPKARLSDDDRALLIEWFKSLHY